MRSHFRFRDYIVKMGLDYSFNEEKGAFTVYTWVRRGGELLFVPVIEVSDFDVRNDFGEVKDRIDMAAALQEIVG